MGELQSRYPGADTCRARGALAEDLSVLQTIQAKRSQSRLWFGIRSPARCLGVRRS